MKTGFLSRILTPVLCLALPAGLFGCSPVDSSSSATPSLTSTQSENSTLQESSADSSPPVSSQASSTVSRPSSWTANSSAPATAYTSSDYLGERFRGQNCLIEWLAGETDNPAYADIYAVWRHFLRLTDQQMISMMFFVTPEQLLGSKKAVTATDSQAVRKALQARPVGGLAFFAQNLTDPDQTRALLEVFDRQASALNLPPLFLGVDEEGGRVSRVANNSAFGITPLPAASALETAQQAYLQGKTIGGYLKSLGFNLDFAPVADLSNADSSVLSGRTFSGNPTTVRSMAQQMAKGLRDAGILSTYKHFPGHGAVLQDTHDTTAVSQKTWEQLRQNDLIPYLSGQLTTDTELVMLGHFACPAITGSQTLPCSLSVDVVTMLRDNMHFDGLIITDALGMTAVTKQYSSDQAALTAVRAGVNLLLMPKDFDAAYSALLKAMNTDTQIRYRVFDSVYRILEYKLGRIRSERNPT